MSDRGVLFDVRGKAGFIILDRQHALNAVTHEMIREIYERLDHWEDDQSIGRIAIVAAAGRAFSAGGDLRALYEWRRDNDPRLVDFYRHEYRLNRRIKTFSKPYIALIDGIVMGGGVGVSFHGSHRIVTENAVFAMPETGIGFFPDVGATWFLGRCPGRIGEYLGLTGRRLGPADVLFAGLATHFVNAARQVELERAIAESDDLDAVLTSLAGEPAPGDLAGLLPAIDRAFAGDTVEAILDVLDQWPGDEVRDWAAVTAATIRGKSPLSQKITLRQIRAGRDLDFDACMALEFRLVRRFVADHDFFEGIRAVVVDKDKAPRWRPASLAAVSEESVARYFSASADELIFED